MRSTIRFLLFLTALLSAIHVAAADIPGSADYHGIGRFEGSEITHFSVRSFDATTLATGPVQKDADAQNALTVEGRITRIVYRVPGEPSAIEVFRNFEQRIEQAGYSVIFAGGPEQIHDYRFKYKHPVEKLNDISLSSKIWYLSAKQSVDGKEVYLSLLVSPHSGGDGQRARLIAAEVAEMEDRMVDAKQMHAGLLESGRVALYGVYFDTDSATVKDSSRPTLDEIATLLRDNPGLDIIVVGHTDNQGGYDHNMELSARRALAVRSDLVAQYEIDPVRLKSAGVGYLAPAASNAGEDGRALNRRVELVLDK